MLRYGDSMKIEWQGRFEYNEQVVKKVVMKKGGNYIILVKLKNGDYRPIYVGKAVCLEERLLAHLSTDEPNLCLRKHVKEYNLAIRYCYIDNEEDRKNIEHTLYKHYNRECNENEPEGKIVDINFPF